MTANAPARTRRASASLTRVRQIFLVVAVLGAFTLGARHILPGEGSRGGSFDAFCPFGGVETLYAYLATGHTLKTVNLLTFSILIGVAGVAVVAGRAFCGWMCPMGGAQEFLAMLARRLSGGKRIRGKPDQARFPIRLQPRADKWLRYLKYVVLAVVLSASATAVYPPLQPLCPARAIFSFKLVTPLLWSVVVTFLLTSILVERFWCKYLCPLGAALVVFNKLSPLRVVADHKRCNDCGRCDHSCPMDIAEPQDNTRSAECIRCLECLETCARPGAVALKLG